MRDKYVHFPDVINSLKYFCENAPQYHIACAGSLLGIALSKPSSFPVGKVKFSDKVKLRIRFSLNNLMLNDDLLNIPLFMADYTDTLIGMALENLQANKTKE
ncbi:MAG: hypothetical protein MSH15_07775 [Oscillospiraceae bacterium]|nr:hypothetical protein [Oscillospiraceae bacterium]